MKKGTNIWKLLLRRWPFRLAIVLVAASVLLKAQSGVGPWVATPVLPTPPSPNARDFFNSAASYAGQQDTAKEELRVIAKVEEGLKYRYLDTNTYPFEKLFNNMYLPDHYHFDWAYYSQRCLGQYSQTDGEVVGAILDAGNRQATHRDWRSAMNYDLDAMNYGADLCHGSSLGGAFAGVDAESMSREQIYPIISRLSFDQAESAERRLEYIQTLEVTASESLRTHEQLAQIALIKLFSQYSWRDRLISFIPDSFGLFMYHPDLAVEFHVDSPWLIYANYTNYMKMAVEFAELSWPDQMKRQAPSAPLDIVNRKLAFQVNTAETFPQTYSLTLNRMLEIQLALQAYHEKYNGYPSTMNVLAPSLINQIPTDPFTDGQPFHYKQKGNSYLLYSVGPDGIDNGGAPAKELFPDPTESKFQIWSVYVTGDIVAGVNE